MLSAGASADGALARNLAGGCHFHFNERQGAGTTGAAGAPEAGAGEQPELEPAPAP